VRGSKVKGKRNGIDVEISVSLVVSMLSSRGCGSRGWRDRGVHLYRRGRWVYRVGGIREVGAREVAREESGGYGDWQSARIASSVNDHHIRRRDR